MRKLGLGVAAAFALVIGAVVVESRVEAAAAPKAFSVLEARDSTGAEVLIVVGNALTAVKSVALTDSLGADQGAVTITLKTKNLLVLRPSGAIVQGDYLIVLGHGRASTVPVLASLTALRPTAGSVTAASLDSMLSTSLVRFGAAGELSVLNVNPGVAVDASSKDIMGAPAIRGAQMDPVGPGTGVLGTTVGNSGKGVEGTSNGLNGTGVAGSAPLTGTGVSGTGATIGVHAESKFGVPLEAVKSLGGTGDIAIFRNGFANTARIDGAGKGFFNGGTQTGGADFAESVRANRPASEFAPGEVVIIDATGVRRFARSSGAESALVAGVVSTKPGVLASLGPVAGRGDDVRDEIQLAVVGIVPTNVCDEGGAIGAGDLLVTASLPGYARRAPVSPRPGTILGKALGGLASGKGSVEVLLMAR